MRKKKHFVLVNQILHGVCCLRNENQGNRKCWCLPIPPACARSSWALFLFVQSVFDELDGEEMRRARTRSNPYEMIRGAFFLNRFVECLVVHPFPVYVYFQLWKPRMRLYLCVHRAAMKMANMDHVFDYMFTNPKDCQGVSASKFSNSTAFLENMEAGKKEEFLSWVGKQVLERLLWAV